MVATDPTSKSSNVSRKERSNEAREGSPARGQAQKQPIRFHEDPPAAGAHAARHLINEDATPGAGVLPSGAHLSGKEVDGGAG